MALSLSHPQPYVRNRPCTPASSHGELGRALPRASVAGEPGRALPRTSSATRARPIAGPSLIRDRTPPRASSAATVKPATRSRPCAGRRGSSSRCRGWSSPRAGGVTTHLRGSEAGGCLRVAGGGALPRSHESRTGAPPLLPLQRTAPLLPREREHSSHLGRTRP